MLVTSWVNFFRNIYQNSVKKWKHLENITCWLKVVKYLGKKSRIAFSFKYGFVLVFWKPNCRTIFVILRKGGINQKQRDLRKLRNTLINFTNIMDSIFSNCLLLKNYKHKLSVHKSCTKRFVQKAAAYKMLVKLTLAL